MKGYGQFCPLAVACETLTERWTPLILRELLNGSRRFNELRRGLPLMSPSLLSKRLRTLEKTGIVTRVTRAGMVEYQLTEAGQELRPVVEVIAAWGRRWADVEVGRVEHPAAAGRRALPPVRVERRQGPASTSTSPSTGTSARWCGTGSARPRSASSSGPATCG